MTADASPEGMGEASAGDGSPDTTVGDSEPSTRLKAIVFLASFFSFFLTSTAWNILSESILRLATSRPFLLGVFVGMIIGVAVTVAIGPERAWIESIWSEPEVLGKALLTRESDSLLTKGSKVAQVLIMLSILLVLLFVVGFGPLGGPSNTTGSPTPAEPSVTETREPSATETREPSATETREPSAPSGLKSDPLPDLGTLPRAILLGLAVSLAYLYVSSDFTVMTSAKQLVNRQVLPYYIYGAIVGLVAWVALNIVL
jgi:hypothetical protein